MRNDGNTQRVPKNQEGEIRKYPTRSEMLTQLNYTFGDSASSSGLNKNTMFGILEQREVDVGNRRGLSRADVKRELLAEFGLSDKSGLNKAVIEVVYDWAYRGDLIELFADNVEPVFQLLTDDKTENEGSKNNRVSSDTESSTDNQTNNQRSTQFEWDSKTEHNSRKEILRRIRDKLEINCGKGVNLSKDAVIKLYKTVFDTFPSAEQSRTDMLKDILFDISDEEEGWRPRKKSYVYIHDYLEDVTDVYTGESLYQTCPVCGNGPVDVQRVRSGEGISVEGDGCVTAKYSGSSSGKVYEHKSLCN